MVVIERVHVLPAGSYFVGNPTRVVDDNDSPPRSIMTESYIADNLYDHDTVPWVVSSEQPWVVLYAYMLDCVSAQIRVQQGSAPIFAKSISPYNAVGIIPASYLCLGDQARYEALEKEQDECTGMFITFSHPVRLKLAVDNEADRDTDLYKWARIVVDDEHGEGDLMLQIWFWGGKGPGCPRPLSSRLFNALATSTVRSSQGRRSQESSAHVDLTAVPLQELWTLWSGIQAYDDVFKIRLGKSYRTLCRALFEAYGSNAQIVDALSHEIARRAVFVSS